MRLNQRRRGDCYYNNNIGATRSQRNLGVFLGHLMVAYLTVSASKKEGRTRETPRARPLVQTLTSA